MSTVQVVPMDVGKGALARTDRKVPSGLSREEAYRIGAVADLRARVVDVEAML